MRKLLSFFLLATTCATMSAGPVTQARAKRLAARFITVDEHRTVLTDDSDAPTYYIYNATDGRGFAIVAGDDALPTLLGYSDTGSIDSRADMPDALRYYLDNFKSYVEALRQGQAGLSEGSRRRAGGESTGTPVVEPLLQTTWSQDAPYNLLCPVVGRTNAPVGCVATAMAQIMRYWEWPLQGTGYASYSTSYGTLSTDFSDHAYDWSVMSAKASGSSSDEEKQAVSQLCYDCGVTVKMDYGSTGSGSHTDGVLTAFYTYFGYEASTLRYYYRECMNTEDEWMGHIKQELDAGRPVQVAAAAELSGQLSGHSFVFDGYDTNDFVHVNWGWAGSSDGYYDPVLLNPPGYEFSQRQAILVGIQPNREGKESTRMQVPPYMQDAPKVTWAQRKTSQFFSVSIGALYNNRSAGHGYTAGVGLYDLDDNFLCDVSMASDTKTFFYPAFMGTNNFGSISCKFAEEPADGYYVLKVIFKEQGYTEWMLPDIVGGSQLNWIPIHVHDGVIDFNEAPAAIGSRTAADAAVVSTACYDLSGRRMARPVKGRFYIQRTVMSDGTVRCVKLKAEG